MNGEQIAGKLEEWKGKIKEGWGEITGDSDTKIDGLQDQVKGSLQQDHGKAKDELEEDSDNQL